MKRQRKKERKKKEKRKKDVGYNEKDKQKK